MKHILAIEGDLIYNLDTGLQEYKTKIVVSEDVFNWLNNHDVEITQKGEKIFIMNKIRYVYLGLNITKEYLQ
jgi:hypothetical protein